MGFAEDVKLSKFELADESERMSTLLYEYGEELADRKAAKDQASTKLELVKAQTELKIRKASPSTYGLEKFTETSIAALVPLDEEVIEAVIALNKAKEAVYHLEAGMEAMRDKSSEIKNLKDLYASGYYTVGTSGTSDGSKRKKAMGE